MATKPPAVDEAEVVEPVKAPAKRKKLLIIIAGAFLVLALGGGGAFYYISKQRAAAADAEAGGSAKEVSHEPRKPPVYLPLDNMVVNLADPGGERVAQVGITLEVTDAHASDSVKAFLPTIRSGVLLLISRRTAEELLKPEGKQMLANDILRETLIPFGGGGGHGESSGKKKSGQKDAESEGPVLGVLFSSFIVQ